LPLVEGKLLANFLSNLSSFFIIQDEEDQAEDVGPAEPAKVDIGKVETKSQPNVVSGADLNKPKGVVVPML
jgi:hypothetical protein